MIEFPEQLVSNFEPELVEEIKQVSKIIHVPVNEVLMPIGKNIRYIPILLSGVLKVSRVNDDGKEIFLYYVNPSESCAMTFTCCMSHQTSEVEATAELDSTLLMIPVEHTEKWINTYTSWRNFIVETMKLRFDEFLKVIDNLAFKNLDERLVKYLKDKSTVTNSSLINLSHEQIAEELATSRVVVSRLLKMLENDGKILLYRGQIKLLREL